MTFFSLRPLRVKSECRVEIRLQNRGSGELLPGLCTGVMVNVSRGGAGLVLSQMLLEGRHLFFSTLNNDQYHLVLFIENPGSSDESFAIPARSVWMDSCRYRDEPAFNMGVCFHERQKKLFNIFKR